MFGVNTSVCTVIPGTDHSRHEYFKTSLTARRVYINTNKLTCWNLLKDSYDCGNKSNVYQYNVHVTA